MPDQVEGVYARIYRCVSRIPQGRVATYGQIAELVGASGPRQVGYALAATPIEIQIPWHRVINARGEVSPRSDGNRDSEQQGRLTAEGVVPSKNGRINLERYRWKPGIEDGLDDDPDEENFWLDRPGVG